MRMSAIGNVKITIESENYLVSRLTLTPTTFFMQKLT